MSTKKFKLTDEDEFVVTSEGLKRVFLFSLNGNKLGELTPAGKLTEGVSFGLSGGGKLRVSLDRGLFGGVDVTFNDKLLRGSASHGRTDWDRTVQLLVVLSVLNISVGIAGHFYQPEFLVNAGLGLNQIIFGAILGVLSFNVFRLRRWALIATMLVWAVGSGVTLLELSHKMGTPQVSAFIVKVYLFYVFVRAFMVDPEELKQ
ncbi:MAG: hypothetical protein KA715_11945 [Xanthomonadaceae bacterium]|nr:hypothetical protein [Xanthomonadaceae bacterium]